LGTFLAVLTSKEVKTKILKGVLQMRYRLFVDRFMLFVDCDNEKRNINRIELEGELPLLVADTRHRSATLWMLTEDRMNEWGFDALDYAIEEQNGETHIWTWHDEDGNVKLQVVISSPKDSPNEELGRMAVAVGEDDGAVRSLFIFMTDFAGWTLIETNGDAEAKLTEYGVQLRDEKEQKLG
jgi:hypothetical protein